MHRTLTFSVLLLATEGAAGAQDSWDGGFDDGVDEVAAVLGVPETKTELTGEVSTENFIYFEDQPDDGANASRHAVDVSLKAEAQSKNTTISATLLARRDFSDDRRDRFEADEAYVDVGKGSTRLRIGRSHAAWGVANLYNPGDILTPVDDSDLLSSEKRAAYMAWLRGSLGPVFWEAFVLPVAEANKVPFPTEIGPDGSFVGSNRWLRGGLPTEIDGMPVTYRLGELPEPSSSLETTQAAGRVSSSWKGIDGTLVYGYLIDRVPSLRTAMQPVDGGVEIELSPVHERQHVVTLEVAKPFGRARVALEAAAVMPRGDLPSYASAVLSFDYLTAEFRDDHSIHLFLDLTTTQPLGDEDLPLDLLSRARYPLVAAALARFEYRVGTELRVRANVIHNFETLGLGRLPSRDGGFLDLAIEPEVQMRLFSTVTGTAGLTFLRGAKGSFFGQFEDNSRLTFSMSSAF